MEIITNEQGTVGTIKKGDMYVGTIWALDSDEPYVEIESLCILTVSDLKELVKKIEETTR